MQTGADTRAADGSRHGAGRAPVVAAIAMRPCLISTARQRANFSGEALEACEQKAPLGVSEVILQGCARLLRTQSIGLIAGNLQSQAAASPMKQDAYQAEGIPEAQRTGGA